MTVHGVVERADSSVGSFYARFGGKDDLLHYLAERVWDEALERWNAAMDARTWSEMSLAEITEGAVGLLIEVRPSRVGRLRDLDRMVAGGDAYERFRRRLIASLQALLLERSGEIAHTEPELTVRLGLGAALGMIETETVADEDAPSEDGAGLPHEVLRRECTELLLAYLTGGAARGGGKGVEFFDVWG